MGSGVGGHPRQFRDRSQLEEDTGERGREKEQKGRPGTRRAA